MSDPVANALRIAAPNDMGGIERSLIEAMRRKAAEGNANAQAGVAQHDASMANPLWGSSTYLSQRPVNSLGEALQKVPPEVMFLSNFMGPKAPSRLPMDHASRMARAAEMGFDTPAYHATGREFDEFKPHPFRGASFFAATEKDALKGATAGANDLTGSGSSRMLKVMLPSDEIVGMALNPAEKKWWGSLPEKFTDDGHGSGIKNALESRPDDISIYAKNMPWYYIYDEARLPDGRFEYTKLPMPKLDWDTAQKTNRDVYGNQWSHYGKGSEKFSSDEAKAQGMSGFAHQDEAGLAIGIVDPTRIRSIDAAFDPTKRNSANIYASMAASSPIVAAAIRAALENSANSLGGDGNQ